MTTDNMTPSDSFQTPLDRQSLRLTSVAQASAIFVAFLGGHAHAVGFGQVHVQSALGEPLRAEVEITDANPRTLNAGLAGASLYQQKGLEHNSATVGNIRSSVELRDRGRMVLVLRSSNPVNDPVVDVVLRASDGRGEVARDFALLLDPQPGAMTANVADSAYAEPHPVAPPVRVQRHDALRQAQVIPTVRAPQRYDDAFDAPAQPTRAAASSRKGDSRQAQASRPRKQRFGMAAQPQSGAAKKQVSQVRVRYGNTASGLALRYRPAGVTMNQMMAAMLQANPHAFVDGNIHRLKSGVVMQMPSRDQLAAVSDARMAKAVLQKDPAYTAPVQQAAPQPAVVAPKPAVTPPAATAPAPKPAPAPAVAPAPAPTAASTPTRPPVPAAVQPQTPPVAPKAPAAVVPTPTTPPPASAAAPTKLAPPQAAPASAVVVAEPVPWVAEPVPTAEPRIETVPGSAPDGVVITAEPMPPDAAASQPTEEEGIVIPPPQAAEAESIVLTPDEPPAPPVAEPEEPAKPQPEPRSSGGESASWLDGFTNPLVLGGGAALFMLLGGLMWARSRNKEDEEPDDSSIRIESSNVSERPFEDESGFLQVNSQLDAHNSRISSNTTFQSRMPQGESSIIDYSHSELQAEDDLDPITEADVYLAYGRERQAEEILKDALKDNPTNILAYAKLLEVYARRKDVLAYDRAATVLKGLTGGTGSEWLVACKNGLELGGDPSLYSAAGQAELDTSALNAPSTLSFPLDEEGLFDHAPQPGQHVPVPPAPAQASAPQPELPQINAQSQRPVEHPAPAAGKLSALSLQPPADIAPVVSAAAHTALALSEEEASQLKFDTSALSMQPEPEMPSPSSDAFPDTVQLHYTWDDDLDVQDAKHGIDLGAEQDDSSAIQAQLQAQIQQDDSESRALEAALAHEVAMLRDSLAASSVPAGVASPNRPIAAPETPAPTPASAAAAKADHKPAQPPVSQAAPAPQPQPQPQQPQASAAPAHDVKVFAADPAPQQQQAQAPAPQPQAAQPQQPPARAEVPVFTHPHAHSPEQHPAAAQTTKTLRQIPVPNMTLAQPTGQSAESVPVKPVSPVMQYNQPLLNNLTKGYSTPAMLYPLKGAKKD